jgi:hypothetical protein
MNSGRRRKRRAISAWSTPPKVRRRKTRVEDDKLIGDAARFSEKRRAFG